MASHLQVCLTRASLLHFLRNFYNIVMDFQSEIEGAFTAFEKLHGLSATLHDLDGRMRSLVNPQRLVHRHDTCVAMKASALQLCLGFDVEKVLREAHQTTRGAIRHCPHGLSEGLLTCLRGQRLAWAIFAGPISGEHDPALVLEGLRQLGARLQLWEEEHPGWPRSPRSEKGGGGDSTSRSHHIRRWIRTHHADAIGLDDLAVSLGLSPSQTSRVVRRACGRGFKELLLDERLATARALLQETELPLMDVALRSGFGNRSHFHRSFLKSVGLPPGQFRRRDGDARP